MLRTFEEILKEQKYNNTNRIYYHGSKDINLNLKNKVKDKNIFYLTPSFDYALNYTRSGLVNKTAIYFIKLKKSLNIFNARSDKDARFLEKRLTVKLMQLNTDEMPEDYLQKEAPYIARYVVNDLSDRDWIDALDNFKINYPDWNIPFRSAIFELLNLDYDGYFNYEVDNNAAGPAIGLFTIDNELNSKIQILKKQIVDIESVNRETWTEYIKKPRGKWLSPKTRIKKEQ